MKIFRIIVAILSISILTFSCSSNDDEPQVLIPIVIPQQLYNKVTSGNYHSLAIKNDGTLWS
jgi:alpha-tubulin suppressor-like RCC1 family protein